MTEPYQQSVEEVLEQQKTSADSGLSPAETRRRRRHYGPNRLRKTAVRPTWRILIDQLKSIVVLLLLSASAAAAVFGHNVEAVAIGVTVLINTLIGFGMELRATRAMEALQRMGKMTARVRRGGRIQEIEADALVPGDIVLLEAGDMVAADLRLLEANELQCDEAALTGESVATDKQMDPLPEREIPLGERNNMAYKGTAVTQGSGSGVAVATGMETELGHISRLVEEAEQAVTPLEKRLDTLGRGLIWLTLVIAMAVMGVGFIAHKNPLVMLETALALAIAAVPEGLPVVATLALAQGMRRMARRNAVVKRLSAVETLGAANLIFTDKTGTLTENHMTVAHLALARGTLTVEDNHGTGFVLDGKRLTPAHTPELQAALEIGALCNNASVEEDPPVGDPTEVALLEAAAKANITREDLLEKSPEAREVSFDPDIKMMATFHHQDGGYRVAVKGAPEAVIDLCSRVLTPEGEMELDDSARERWHERSDTLASEGLRILTLAQKSVDDEQTEPYQDLTLLGLAGLYDPPRAGIQSTISQCQAAGVRVVMGTGDHAATARAIATEIGLAGDKNAPVEAAQLKNLDSLVDDERDALLKRSVFARISPEQKLDLIRLYQDTGWVVAMTGDGVNDAPGLKKADIGIAMGKRGTEVAREAADMVLKDDAFATIVAAIEHGRTIFQNIRRFIVYLLSGNLGEVMAISAAGLAAAPLPMLPLQILYINFVCDVLPALALGLSPGEIDVMRKPPRDPGEPILLRRHWVAIIGYGAFIAVAVLGAFAVALEMLHYEAGQAVTIGFLCFGFARLWHIFNMRSPDSPTFLNEVTCNRFVWVSIAVGIGLLLAATYVPVLAKILSVHAPGREGWLLSLSFSVLPLILVQPLKWSGLLWETHATGKHRLD
ncbi:cation-translocating P-type ATPase [Methylohalobius crimeensis]|uniref:cation-translocating P-type ATPase n=1 Tax=Methylohalobius crimeensis TaxID=244365 RepID=UPI0003B5B6D9|nr:cation-transporting P-type ATPase [Methylohalobius crimeensis]